MLYINTLIALLLTLSLSCFAQQKRLANLFDDIDRFQKMADEAIVKGDSLKYISYSEDSIRNAIVNSHIDNYRFLQSDGKPLYLEKIEKPILLLVTASWCAPCKSLSQPFKKIAAVYKNE